MEPDKKLELLTELIALTSDAKLQWREEAPGTFAAALPRHFLTLSSRDRDHREPFTLMVEDADSRTVVDFVTTIVDREPGDPPPPLADETNRGLHELYELVHRRLLDLDQSVAALFEDLGQIRRGETS